MTDESGVTIAETGMLAENLRDLAEEVAPAPAKAAEKAEPQPKKKAAPTPPAASSVNPPPPATPPPSRPVEEDKPEKAESGKLNAMIQNILYAVIGLLVIGQIASFVKISATGSKMEELEKALVEAKKEFRQREADQDKTFTEALQEKEKNVIESRKMSVAAETLNRLRDGAPEKKVIRRQGGDWFIMGKKEEPIGNAEAIEVLNNAYTRAKSVEKPVEHMPPHTGNAICVLKPDGRGGTQVSIAYDYIVGEAKSAKH